MSTTAKLGAVFIVLGVIAIPLLLKTGSSSSRKKRVPSAPCDSANGMGKGHCSALNGAKPRPRILDIGTTTCAPCRVMLGVMDKLERRYPNTLEVQFINIKKDRGAGRRYGVRVIPLQIFYSPDGRELFRHKGVIRPGAVAEKFKKLGYDLDDPKSWR